MKSKHIFDSLKKLSLLTLTTTKKYLSTNKITFEEIDYIKDEITIEEGVISRLPVPFKRKVWNNAAYKILEIIKKTDEYNDAFEKLSSPFKRKGYGLNETDPQTFYLYDDLESFLEKLVLSYLENNKVTEDRLDHIITIFTKDVMLEPLDYLTKVNLGNISLEDDSIIINDDLVLRKPVPEDLTRIYPSDHMILEVKEILNSPSVILTFKESLINNQSLITVLNIIKWIKILRLYKVGNVSCINYETWSETLTFFRKPIQHSQIICDYEKSDLNYNIKSSEVASFNNFWNKMDSLSEESFKHVHVEIAYDHYSRALKKDKYLNSIPTERRIAECIIGLEALFLKEKQELSYRLSLRLGKIINLLGLEEHKSAKTTVKKSYDIIRNSILHGSYPKEKDSNKLKKEYGTLEKLLYKLLDYLRISIIIMILNSDKNKLIELTDDSLVNKESEKELKNLLDEYKDYI